MLLPFLDRIQITFNHYSTYSSSIKPFFLTL